MNIQQAMIQAQRMKRELAKAQAELAKQEVAVSKGGAVTVTLYGSGELKSIDIQEDALDKDNKEMLEDLLVLAFNEAKEQVEKAIGDINERITGSRDGLGF